MDFASLNAIDTVTGSTAGADLVILGLDGKPLLNAKGEKHVLRLLGPDSQDYRASVHAQTQRRIKAAAAASERGEKFSPDPDESKADAIEVLVRCTIGGSGFLDKDGNAIDITREAARALYTRYPVIYEQADGFIARRGNFLPVSSNG